MLKLVTSDNADISTAFNGQLASTSGVMCTIQLVNTEAAPAAVAGAVQSASLPAVLPLVALQCQGGGSPPTITGGPDVVGYASTFTGM